MRRCLGRSARSSEHRPRDWNEKCSSDTNVIGVMNACRAVLPQMVQRRSGKVLVIADASAASPRPNFAPYAASKAAVVRFVESVAEEVRNHNIQINCFSPGGANTSMTDEILRADELRRREENRRSRTNPSDPAGCKYRRISRFSSRYFLRTSWERSNHLTGKLINVTDDLKKLEHENTRPGYSWTLRRHLK